MKLESVYIETTIPSYLTARASNDLRAAANQNTTVEWWENRKSHYDVFISEFVMAEAGQGDPSAAARRVAVIQEIPRLEANESVRELAEALINEGPIPPDSRADAYHIAIAAVHGVDYLLTWNCTHIANAAMRPKVEVVCRSHGYEPPIICTPLELMED